MDLYAKNGSKNHQVWSLRFYNSKMVQCTITNYTLLEKFFVFLLNKILHYRACQKSYKFINEENAKKNFDAF